MIRSRRFAAVVAALALVPALAACGGGDDEPASTGSAPPPATSPPATATSPQTPTTSGVGTAELLPALLQTVDLGGNWSAGRSGAGATLCGYEALENEATGEARVAFANDSPPSSLGQTVHRLPAGTGPDLMRRAEAAFGGCDQELDGGRYRLSTSSAPALGDEALRFEGEVTPEAGAAFPVEVVFIRRGDLITTVVWSGEANSDRAFLSGVYAAADERLGGVAGG